MSSTTSTSSSSTWTEEHHQELQENQEIDHDQDNEAWWASYSGLEAAEIAEHFSTSSSATCSDNNGPEISPIKWSDHAPDEFQQAINFYEAQQQGHQEFSMCDSSSEGSCRQTTKTRRRDRRPLTAKKLEIFDKEMKRSSRIIRAPLALRVANPLESYLFDFSKPFVISCQSCQSPSDIYAGLYIVNTSVFWRFLPLFGCTILFFKVV